MRNFIFFIIISIFTSGFLIAQAEFTDDEWINFVDYVNAKATEGYLDGYMKNSPAKTDEEFYKDKLKPKLIENTLEHPILYDSLSALMESQFRQTHAKISSQIELLKENTHKSDLFYKELEKILTSAKMNAEDRVSLINSLKEETSKFFDQNSQVSTVSGEVTPIPGMERIVKKDRTQRKGIFSIYNITTSSLILLILVLTYYIIKKKKEIKALEEKLKKSKNRTNTVTSPNIQRKSPNRDEKIEELEKDLAEANLTIRNLKELQRRENDSEAPVVVELEVPKAPIVPKEFFAGKPTPDRKFIETSDKIKDQETIFKFTLLNNSEKEANFEVILASEFMIRQIINAPDDFLYRVCNNINSNQSFRKKIVTERKGIARLRDGAWIVDEDDKALIKFQ